MSSQFLLSDIYFSMTTAQGVVVRFTDESSHLLSPDPEINIPSSVSMKLIPQFKNCYNWEGTRH